MRKTLSTISRIGLSVGAAFLSPQQVLVRFGHYRHDNANFPIASIDGSIISDWPTETTLERRKTKFMCQGS